MPPFDYSPLSSKVSPKDMWRYLKTSWGDLLSAIVTVLFAFIFVGIVVRFAQFLVSDGQTVPAVLALTVGPVVAVGIALFPFFGNASIRSTILVQRFIEKNNLTSLIDISNPDYESRLFQRGTSRSIQRGFRFNTPRPVDFGEYTYATGTGKTQHTWYVGFVRIELPVVVPNIVLSPAKLNLTGVFLSEYLGYSQKIHLEGNFNDYFNVYIPSGYDVDVRTILTPDFMQVLINNAKDYDIEFVGTGMYIFRSGYWGLHKPQTIQYLLNLVQKVGKEASEESANYADARSGEKGAIAATGKELKGIEVSFVRIFVTVGIIVLIGVAVVAVYISQGLHQ